MTSTLMVVHNRGMLYPSSPGVVLHSDVRMLVIWMGTSVVMVVVIPGGHHSDMDIHDHGYGGILGGQFRGVF